MTVRDAEKSAGRRTVQTRRRAPRGLASSLGIYGMITYLSGRRSLHLPARRPASRANCFAQPAKPTTGSQKAASVTSFSDFFIAPLSAPTPVYPPPSPSPPPPSPSLSYSQPFNSSPEPLPPRTASSTSPLNHLLLLQWRRPGPPRVLSPTATSSPPPPTPALPPVPAPCTPPYDPPTVAPARSLSPPSPPQPPTLFRAASPSAPSNAAPNPERTTITPKAIRPPTPLSPLQTLHSLQTFSNTPLHNNSPSNHPSRATAPHQHRA